MKLKLMFITILFAAVFSILPVQADMGGFSVTPVFPNNQNPATHGFFDLRVIAGSTQEFAVTVGNTGDAPAEISLSLITASTNRNGIVSYTMQGIADETMLHPFAEIAQIADGYERVAVAPGESVQVPISVEIPAEGFDGIILGSIHALLEITDEERAQAGMIVNRFAHVLVVRLQENDTEIGTNFELGEVTPELVHHRASIVAEIRNPMPRLSMGALAHAQIYPLGGDTPIFSMANINVDFAPNSIFPFSMIDEAGFGLQPGSYTAQIQLEHGGVEWDWEREFEILPQEAEEINTAAVNIQQQPVIPQAGGIPIYLLIGAAAVLLAAIIVIVTIIISRNNKKQTELQNERFKKQMEELRASLGQPTSSE